MAMDRIHVNCSPLTRRLELCRVGANGRSILERREAEAEVYAAVTKHMLHDMPEGAVKEFGFGGKWFRMTLEPIEPPADGAST